MYTGPQTSESTHTVADIIILTCNNVESWLRAHLIYLKCTSNNSAKSHWIPANPLSFKNGLRASRSYLCSKKPHYINKICMLVLLKNIPPRCSHVSLIRCLILAYDSNSTISPSCSKYSISSHHYKSWFIIYDARVCVVL